MDRIQAKQTSTSSAGSSSWANSQVKCTADGCRARPKQFSRAGQLLVSTNAVDGIAERPGANGGNRDRIAALHAIFRSEFESGCRITTDLSHSAVEGKEFLGGEKDLVLAEQADGQACTAQDRRGRELSIIEPSSERIGNSKSVHDAV